MIYSDIKNQWFVRETKLEDLKVLVEEMSKENIEELWVAHHLTPKEVLEMAFSDSIKALTIEIEGIPVGIFGIRNAKIHTAEIYLLVTNRFSEVGALFLRNARIFIDDFLKLYPYLDGWVYTQNSKSIFWMKYCKATIEQPMPYGIERRLFSHFFFI